MTHTPHPLYATTYAHTAIHPTPSQVQPTPPANPASSANGGEEPEGANLRGLKGHSVPTQVRNHITLYNSQPQAS
jgi:hypothetical protein